MSTTIFEFIDNSGAFKKELQNKLPKILEMLGLQAEGYAQLELESHPRRVDTGNLRNSIRHSKDENAAYSGTNVDYAIYVHEGTGKYAVGGGGRQTPWRYQDDEGNWHTTTGMLPNRFLRNAVEKHTEEYKQIIKSEMQE